MLFIIGLIIVVVSVLGGYVLHHGQLILLWQPSEFIIICGAAFGSFLITNPMDIVKATGKQLKYLFKTKPYTKHNYIELLTFLFTIFKLMKTKGMLALEAHVEDPNSSDIFQQFPEVIKDHHILAFICDALRLLIMGVDNYFHMEELIDKELEVHEIDANHPSHALINVGESLPAFGIVAAVLGVINTMRSISSPPQILGMLIAGALVGTFVGVLLAYGIVLPMGNFLHKYHEAEHQYLKCIKAGIIAHMQGNAPAVTVEFVRKLIPPLERPTFHELENALNERSNT
ncbi:Chemotaxis protein MotA [Rickettsiales bacterium Ac37b]|nr:Chemotaxis protein MotA [Rickettsiales bacterium Ac37b]